jgi:O-methyltransferase
MTPEEIEFCRQVTALSLGGVEVKLNTWELAERALVEGIPGNFAEAGVFAGAHVAVMARVLMKYGIKDRRIHLFDSFEGIPKAGPRDDDGTRAMCGVGAMNESSGVSVCSVAGVRGYMQMWGVDESLLVFHPGWFCDVLPKDAPGIGALALLRLDVDLYDSTTDCLEWLYPHLSPGAFVIDDDYGGPGARTALEDYLLTKGLRVTPTPVAGQETTVWWRR